MQIIQPHYHGIARTAQDYDTGLRSRIDPAACLRGIEVRSIHYA